MAPAPADGGQEPVTARVATAAVTFVPAGVDAGPTVGAVVPAPDPAER
jgi:hypothetical protein